MFRWSSLFLGYKDLPQSTCTVATNLNNFRAINQFQVVRPIHSMCSPQSYQDMSSSVKLSNLHQVKYHAQTVLSSVTIPHRKRRLWSKQSIPNMVDYYTDTTALYSVQCTLYKVRELTRSTLSVRVGLAHAASHLF